MGAIVSIETHLLGDQRVSNIVNGKTFTNDETIQEAIDGGYVNGKLELISSNTKGLLKSMLAGIQKDGNGRKIDEYFSLQPYPKGRLDDITDDISKDKIDVRVKARALKQLALDTSDWTINVEGSTGDLRISTVTTGEESGHIVVNANEAVHINGSGLKMGADDYVKYYIPDTEKSNPTTIAAEKLTSDATRITIAADVFADLTDDYQGKTIVFDIRIGNNRAVKRATIVLV